MRKLMLLSALLLVAVATTAQPAQAQFSVNCRFSHALMDDPIVFPGVPGAAHLHTFFGNKTTNAFSTYATMLAGGTTCRFSKDTAGYWVPALIVNGQVQPPVSINAYYRPPNQYVDKATVVPFPADFRMLAGGNTVTDPSVAYWSCNDQPATRTPLPGNCGSSLTVHANVSFPSCWDGLNIDASDHRSHVAYPAVDGGCPDAYPVPVPRLTVIARYALHDGTGATLSSGDATTLHGDFWNTWQQAALEAQVARCINVKRKCLNLRG